MLHNVGVAASHLPAAQFIEAARNGGVRQLLLDGLPDVTLPLGFRVDAVTVHECRELTADERRSMPPPPAAADRGDGNANSIAIKRIAPPPGLVKRR